MWNAIKQTASLALKETILMIQNTKFYKAKQKKFRKSSK